MCIEFIFTLIVTSEKEKEGIGKGETMNALKIKEKSVKSESKSDQFDSSERQNITDLIEEDFTKEDFDDLEDPNDESIVAASFVLVRKINMLSILLKKLQPSMMKHMRLIIYKKI